MGQPAAKQGDQIIATDTHIVLVPAPPGPPVPTPLPHPFTGVIQGNLSSNVKIMGMPAATLGSTANNQPPHIPTPPGVSFQIPPTNQGTIIQGSANVMINHKPAARNGDTAQTCSDPAPIPGGRVVAVGTVLIGG
jgi:uncharacterized Zn-binding protein involved in type VI secretion